MKSVNWVLFDQTNGLVLDPISDAQGDFRRSDEKTHGLIQNTRVLTVIKILMKATEATDIVIIDEIETCPYLPEKNGKDAFAYAFGQNQLVQADQRACRRPSANWRICLSNQLPNCKACEPIRIDCFEFEFSRNQRRVLNKAIADSIK